MDNSLSSIQFPEVLELIAMEAKSVPGKYAVMGRRPATNLADCELLQSQLAEMVRYYQTEGLLPFAGLVETRPIFEGDEIDLAAAWTILRSARATQSVRESILRTDGVLPRLQELAASIDDLGAVIAATGRYFTREGKLREEASATLRSLRSKIISKRQSIQKTLNDLMSRHPDAVQEPIITVRQDRYVIPMRAERRTEVPGILHERSGSGASFFVEPISVLEANNELADLLIEEREEIVRITREIVRELMKSAADINHAVDVAGELDAIQAAAVLHDMLRASRPSFSTDRTLRLTNARHPLLDERLKSLRATAFDDQSDNRVVPTTVEIGPESCALVISGPNAGGKTVALKTAGLLVAMACSGLPLPADEGSVVPVVDSIYVLIGDDQSVLAHLSTFSAYLHRLKRIIERASSRSLVLLDELGSGTDPEEGSALAASVIEHLTERGSLLIATTHLSALKSFAIEDGRIANASMEFDPASGTPTFRLVLGVPGRSRAIDAARNVGIPAAIIESATRRLGEDYGKFDQLLAELQETQAALQKERDNLALIERRLAEQLERSTAEQKRFEEERKKVAAKYRDELDQLRDDIGSKVNAELRHLRELDRKEREKLQPHKVIERVVAAIPQPQFEERAELRVGDEAEHRKFKLVGKIVSIDGKRAQFALGGKRMEVELSDLRPKGGATPKQTPPPRPSSSSDEPEIGAELNLVGMRVDDALEESDRFIDRALLAGHPAVRLIHGFGTGALRKAIREQLRKHRGVKSYRAGNEREGGDGATIALLDT
jgi:DNA mismatch repair protein MutS2